jgi:ribose transport system substrate-binding protein
MRKNLTLVAAALAAALALTACGGSDSGAGKGPSSKAFSADAKAEAQKIVDQYGTFPSAPDLKPLGKTPPTDVSVVNITCPLPACTPQSDAFEDGASKLGWKAKTIVSDFAPDAYISAWESAIAAKPDGILFITMLPNKTIQEQLDKAKKAGIWVVASAPAPDTEIGGDAVISAAVQPLGRVELMAKIQASKVIADAQSTEGITFLHAPQAPSYKYHGDQFKKDIEAAGGSVDFLEASQQDIGTKVPDQVVSYLQSHPDTKYLVALDDSWLPGIPEAIEAAGIKSPKLIGVGVGQEPTLINKGQEFAEVTGDLATDGWNAVDLMARLSVGETPESLEPNGVLWLVTKENAAKYPKVFPGIPDAYTTAWGVS